MRIIAGKFRGKVILAPKNIPTRPTTDFAKTGLFNILKDSIDFETVRLLDLFAGTGSITFEFASRGCNDSISVEQNPVCFKHLLSTVKELDLPGSIIYRADVFKFLKKNQEPFDIIFADPPFRLKIKDQLINIIFDKQLLKQNGLLILEQGERDEVIKNEYFVENRNYGHVSFSIYKYHS